MNHQPGTVRAVASVAPALLRALVRASPLAAVAFSVVGGGVGMGRGVPPLSVAPAGACRGGLSGWLVLPPFPPPTGEGESVNFTQDTKKPQMIHFG